MNSPVRSECSSFSSSSDTALLSAAWPDLFATDRQLLQNTQSTSVCDKCIELVYELLNCGDLALFNAVSYMELHYRTSQHLQDHDPLIPIAEQLRTCAMSQPVGTQDYDVHQSTDLEQGEDYHTDFCKYIFNDDVQMGGDEDIAGIDIDAEPEQYSDLGKRTSPFATADERQVCIYSSYLSRGPNDVWSRTARWIAHVQAENQLIRNERSMRGPGTGPASQGKYPLVKRKADDADAEFAMRSSKRAKFLQVFSR